MLFNGSGSSFTYLVVSLSVSLLVKHTQASVGVDLVNCTTNHIYDLRTQTYLQPKYAFQLLQRMWTVNKAAFENIYLQKEIRLEKQVIPAKTNLVKAIGIVLDERQKSGSYTSSPAVLEGVMQALEAQAK